MPACSSSHPKSIDSQSRMRTFNAAFFRHCSACKQRSYAHLLDTQATRQPFRSILPALALVKTICGRNESVARRDTIAFRPPRQQSHTKLMLPTTPSKHADTKPYGWLAGWKKGSRAISGNFLDIERGASLAPSMVCLGGTGKAVKVGLFVWP